MEHRHDPQEHHEDKDSALHLDWMCSALSSCKEKLDVKPLKNLYVRALRISIDLTCSDEPQLGLHAHSLPMAQEPHFSSDMRT